MCAFKEVLHSDSSPLNQSVENMWNGFRQGVCSATEEVIPPSTYAKKEWISMNTLHIVSMRRDARLRAEDTELQMPYTRRLAFMMLSSFHSTKERRSYGVRELQRYNTPAGTRSFVQWKDDTLINASLRVFPNALKERKQCLGIEWLTKLQHLLRNSAYCFSTGIWHLRSVWVVEKHRTRSTLNV